MKPIHPPLWLVVTAMTLAPAASCKDDKKPAKPEKTSVVDASAVKTQLKKPPERRKKADKTPPKKGGRSGAVPSAPTRAAARAQAGDKPRVARGATHAARPAASPTPRSEATGSKTPVAAPVSPPASAGGSAGLREPRIPDLRLLLTATDVTQNGGGRSAFRRRAMPGMVVTPDQDALYYEPEKGSSYGFGIQVFHEKNMARAKQRFESMFASYPNSVEIAPVAGNTFFAYWDEVLFVSFMNQHNGLIVVLSCGRPYCDSDSLYALAKKVSSRIR
ncbi:MAG: hypothetical protein GXP54_08270 [Deltaproteobacteria bacterium]|nr:hypothetical protein [Deltaproteobacteria bacterium]